MRTATVVLVVGLAVLAGPTWVLAADPVPAAKALKKPIPKISLNGVPLERAVKLYQELTGTSVRADWEGLKQAGVTKDSLVIVAGKNLTFAQVLDLTVDNIADARATISWFANRGTIYITTQVTILQAKQLIARSRAPLPIRKPAGTPAKPRAAATPKAKGIPAIPSLNFDNVEFERAIEFLRQHSSANFFVNWQAMEAVGIERSTPVTLKVRNVTFTKALDLVLDTVNGSRGTLDRAYWIVDRGVFTITTGSGIDRELVVRVFDVSDLLIVVPNFRSRQFGSGGQNGRDSNNRTSSRDSTSIFGSTSDRGSSGRRRGSYDDDDDDDDVEGGISHADAKANLETSLIDMIKSTTGEVLWAPTGRGSIRILNGKMIISQTRLGFKLMEQALGGG